MAEPPHVVHDSDIDPELVRLKRRVPVGPVLAASVLGFALLLLVRLRADFAYAGQGDTPVDLGRAAAPTKLVDGAYATLAGRPDAVAPIRVRGAQETGHRLAPFLGSGGRVWLEDTGDASQSTLGFDDRWTGRLRAIADTSFGDELGRYLAAAPPEPRVVFPAALAAAPPTVDTAGDPLPLAPDTRVAVDLVVPERARVVFVKTDDIPDEAAARGALGRLGFTAGEPVETTDASWTYDLAARPADVNAALRKARLFGAAASPRLETAVGTVADLDLRQPDRIVLAGREVPRAAAERVTFWVARRLPEGAFVLVSGDTPAGLWYMRPLFAMLAIIAILMLWALVVDLRQLRRARPKPRLEA